MSLTLTEAQFTDLRSQYSSWRIVEKAEGRPYPHVDDFEEVAARAIQYGVLNGFIQAAWTRGGNEAQEAGVIRLNKPAPVLQPIPADFPAQINAMTSTQLRTKLNRDAEFAALYGRWATGEKPEGTCCLNPSILGPFHPPVTHGFDLSCAATLEFIEPGNNLFGPALNFRRAFLCLGRKPLSASSCIPREYSGCSTNPFRVPVQTLSRGTILPGSRSLGLPSSTMRPLRMT